MGRPRKPTSQLELSGAFKHDPQRKRPGEPVDNRTIGYAPKRLPEEVKPFWQEIVDMLPGAILTFRDRWAVELAARLMWKAVSQPSVADLLAVAAAAELDAGELKKLAKEKEISSAELSTLRSLLGALGMTPADRSKLSIPTEKPKANAFTDLAEEDLAEEEHDRPRPN